MPNQQTYLDAPDYCHPFFDHVKTDDLIFELKQSGIITREMMLTLPDDKLHFKYAENKWSVLEVFRHIIDCERVYTYRAFRFSRFDDTPLAGFDENAYIANTDHLPYTMQELIEEFDHMRYGTISLYEHMTPEMLDFKGKANQHTFTARSLGFMTVGHNLHHLQVLRSLYLV